VFLKSIIIIYSYRYGWGDHNSSSYW